MDYEHMLGCQAYNTRTYDTSECSSAGLPLTPCSIRVHGRFQRITKLRHPRLCKYIDCSRSGNEAVLFVLEYGKMWLKRDNFESADVFKYSYQILQGLNYLHENGIAHHGLDWSCLNLNSTGDVQLINYAIHYASLGGVLMSAPFDVPRFMSPEKLMSSDSPPHLTQIPENDAIFDHSGADVEYDMWSFGLLLLEMACHVQLWEFLSLKQVFSKLVLLFEAETNDEQLLDAILKCNKIDECFSKIDNVLQSVIRACIKRKPEERLSCKEIMLMYPESLRIKLLVAGKATDSKNVALFEDSQEPIIEFSKLPLKPFNISQFIYTRPCEEIFLLWQLAGGSIAKEMQKQGLLKLVYQICRFPNCISKDGIYTGNEAARILKANNKVVELSISSLQQKLSFVPMQSFFPLLCFKKKEDRSQDDSMRSMASNIKEVDVEYQLERIVLFHRLLRAYPVTKKLLVKEALIDIPPHYRNHTWAALLHINCTQSYTSKTDRMLESIDFSVSLPSDKQIEVDIPRCHQYHTLLSSPTAHDVLRTVIRAWVISNPDLVYWQGLDSLAAPFVCLHFNKPALAFSCLSQFIKKYLYKFFLADNSAVIQEFLTCFSQVIAFHDPELFYHLHEQNFSPNLYAMPWFLTMFAHTFPISKVYHLWDTLILQGPSFPLFIGAAILKLLRTQLLAVDFDGAILLFSDIPEIEVEAIKTVSVQLAMATPPSCLLRNWINPDLYHTQFLSSSRGQGQSDTPAIDAIDYPLIERQLDWCPRIHHDDVIALIKQRDENSTREVKPTQCQFKLSKFIIFDIRPKSEFDRGHLPESVNFNYTEMSTEDEKKIDGIVFENVMIEDNCLIIVVGPSNNVSPCRNFTNLLIKLGYPKVCFVHGGADVFASTNLMIVS